MHQPMLALLAPAAGGKGVDVSGGGVDVTPRPLSLLRLRTQEIHVSEKQRSHSVVTCIGGVCHTLFISAGGAGLLCAAP